MPFDPGDTNKWPDSTPADRLICEMRKLTPEEWWTDAETDELFEKKLEEVMTANDLGDIDPVVLDDK